jgi:stage V sporulation protein S
MDRFFSKLDLRDIKIKPEGSRFLPDDDEGESLDEQALASVSVEEQELDVEETDSVPYVPSPGNGQVVTASYERVTVTEWESASAVIEIERAQDPVPLNGNAEVLKVSAKSRPSAVAGAIAGVVRENGRAEVQAIGAGATNQAVKAIAIAREYLLETDIDAVCVPAFIDVTIDNEERTAIRLVIEKR